MEWRARDVLLEELSNTDGLTGLCNRRHFMEILTAECERAQRTNKPLSLIMCDADHFKNVNDTYGHHVGDHVLQAISSVLQDSTRVATDIAARLGGEEFGILFAETDIDIDKVVAESIINKMWAISFNSKGEAFTVTLSLGLQTLNANELGAEKILEEADILLYKAKGSGRNKVVMRKTLSGEVQEIA